eukprot:m.123953 g.123953  ORF g.123953 m.123953 type:complete len:67 (+) comp14459_c1_seq15:832-1032(+)
MTFDIVVAHVSASNCIVCSGATFRFQEHHLQDQNHPATHHLTREGSWDLESVSVLPGNVEVGTVAD